MYSGIGRLRPYAAMYASNAPAARSVLLPVPAVPTTGVVSGVVTGDVLFLAVSLCATLAQLLPVALANIPYDRTTMYYAYTTCVYVSVAIAAVMLLTLFFVFFHKQPALPVQPRTLAATLYYLDGSDIPERFGPLAMLGAKERNRHVAQMGLRYSLSEVVGPDGSSKIGFRVAYQP